MRPAWPLLMMELMTLSMSASSEAAPGKRHARATRSDSRPHTSRTIGSVISASGSKLIICSSGLGCMSPKYFSIMSIASSKSKSPDIQMAILLGTYHCL